MNLPLRFVHVDRVPELSGRPDQDRVSTDGHRHVTAHIITAGQFELVESGAPAALKDLGCLAVHSGIPGCSDHDGVLLDGDKSAEQIHSRGVAATAPGLFQQCWPRQLTCSCMAQPDQSGK